MTHLRPELGDAWKSNVHDVGNQITGGKFCPLTHIRRPYGLRPNCRTLCMQRS